MVSNLLNIAILFLLVSCHSQNDTLKEPNETIKTLPLSNDWIRDKNGCLKLRSEKLAYKLISENNLKNGVKEDFIKVFGAANKIDKINNKEVLIYYFDCICINNKLREDGDKCYANFYFEIDKLKSEEFICE